jgi:hypothetical protein
MGQALIQLHVLPIRHCIPIPNNIANAGIADFNSLQFNCQHCQFNSIQFPASGARNMGEVRNHTSLYFPSISLYLAYRDGRWDERLPASSASAAYCTQSQ